MKRKYVFSKRKKERPVVETKNLSSLIEAAETFDEMIDVKEKVTIHDLSKKVDKVLHVKEGVTGRRLLNAKRRM